MRCAAVGVLFFHCVFMTWLGGPPVAAQDVRAETAARADLRANAEGFARLIAEHRPTAARFFRRHARENAGSVAARIGFIQAQPARAFTIDEPVAPHVESRPEAARTVADWAVLFEIAHRRNDRGRAKVAIDALRALDTSGIWWRYAALRHVAPADRPQTRSVQRSGRWALFSPAFGEWRPSPAIMGLADPLLRPNAGTLLFWIFFLEHVGTGIETELEGARRAIAADPSSPLAPALRLTLARYESDGQRRWDAYESIATDAPTSPFVSHARFRQATMLDRNRARRGESIAYYERVLADEQSKHALVSRANLADLYPAYRPPEQALEKLLALEAKNPFPFHRQVVRLLLDLDRGELADARLDAWKDTLAAPPAKPEGPAGDRGDDEPDDVSFVYATPSHLDYWWLRGDRLSTQSRFEEAFAVYHRLQQARDARQFISLEPWNTWRLPLRVGFALFRSSPFAVAGMLTLPFLWGLALAVSAIIFVAQFTRAKRFLPWAVGLAVVVAGMDFANRWLAVPHASTSMIIAVGFSFLRTLLVASAASVLLGSVGVKHAPFARAILRPRSRHVRRLPQRIVAVLGGLFAVAALTILVARLIPHEVNPFFKRMAEAFPSGEHALLTGDGSRWRLALLVCRAALNEELLFRGVLLGITVKVLRRTALSRAGAGTIAIGFTAIAFAIPHAGMVSPDWAKMVQVGGLGVIFGAITLRHGLGASMFLHLALNSSVIFLSERTS